MKTGPLEDALLLAWFNRAYYKERRDTMETYPRINAFLDGRVIGIVERKLQDKD